MNDNEEWQQPADENVADVEQGHEEIHEQAHFEPAPENAQRAPRLLPLVLVSALVAGVTGGAAGYYAGTSQTHNNNVVLTQSGAGNSSRPAGSIAAIASAVTPSVVSIKFTSSAGTGSGSGFIVDSSGYIATNNHVIADVATSGGSIEVDLADGRSFPAKIVGRNSAYDLAVIKIDATDLKALPLGNSENAVVGDSVVAIGSPLGLEGTVTSGIISAINRPVTAGGDGEMSYISGLQTDAAINPGNSGGPLVNASGEVIGINSSIATMGNNYSGSQSGSIGLGFAIPINIAKRIIEELIQSGTSTMPVLGVQLDMQSSQDGALLAEIASDGAAAKAGLKANTVITMIDDTKVHDAVGLIVAVRSHIPGDVVKLTDSNGKTYSVTLGGTTTSS